MTNTFHLKRLWITFFVVVMAACSQASSLEMDMARDTLLEYFEALHSGDHQRVVEIYGGSYEILQDWNPDIAEDDYELLFWYACNVNGAVCLRIKNVVQEIQVGDEYIFTVEFQLNNGDLFVLGPCCGASQEGDAAQTQFDFTVRKMDGQYLVQELPVYSP
jgi:hypothetical protein